MKLSKNALKVLEARYLLRDKAGKLSESPEELFLRVASSIAEAEKIFKNNDVINEKTELFYDMMASFDFLPNSPTLMNAGTPLGQLSACFAIPVGDSLNEIFDAIKNMALIQKTGGGTGFSFSRLRPKNSLVHSSGGRSSGPVSFMKIFDEATEHIKQGGKRRGANMGVLRVDHPDIMEFINVKKTEGELRNFNLSVGITDRFMHALEHGEEFELKDPVSGNVTKKINAHDIFDSITRSAWECGDPGVLFLDTINNSQTILDSGPIETTNPCGELPLLEYESCNLGSVNLSNMIFEKDGKRIIDWEKLGTTVGNAVRFLDNVIEINRFPLKEIETVTRRHRKIGLGVMGFADMLIKLRIPYASEEAILIAGDVMSFIYDNAIKASCLLAEERGIFPAWEKSVYAGRELRIRNATLTSIAPTGTISIIAGTSSGIEPLFALLYERKNVLRNENLFEVNPVFLEYCRNNNLDTKFVFDQLRKKRSLGRVKGFEGPAGDVFCTALEIPYPQHIRIQAAFQKHVDNSVSKTINMPYSCTVEDVKKAYLMAYRLSCKGITVYRYGSRQQQVLDIEGGQDWYEKEYYLKCDPHECRL